MKDILVILCVILMFIVFLALGRVPDAKKAPERAKPDETGNKAGRKKRDL